MNAEARVRNAALILARSLLDDHQRFDCPACAENLYCKTADYALCVIWEWDTEFRRIPLAEVLAAIKRVRDLYPVEVFPEDGTSIDAGSARMARLTCDNILREIASTDEVAS